MSQNNDEAPWDIKHVKISLGGVDDEDGWLHAEVFNDREFSIGFTGVRLVGDDEGGQMVESIPLEAARRLRDFLNYAMPR